MRPPSPLATPLATLDAWDVSAPPPALDGAAASEALRELTRQDPSRALALAEKLLTWARARGDSDATCRALRAAGHVASVRGESAQAVELYRSALAGFEAASDELEAGRTHSSLVTPLRLLGQRDAALEAATAARRCFEAAGAPLRLARLEINLANVHLQDDDFAPAQAALERASQAMRESDDAEGLTAIYLTRAAVHTELTDFERAEADYAAARALADRHGMALAAAQADYNLAALWLQRGRYDEAVRGLEQARATARRFGDLRHAALCDRDLAELFLRLNDWSEASRLAALARNRFRAQNLPEEEGRALLLQARAALALRSEREALDHLRAAETCFVAARNEFLLHATQVEDAVALTALGEAAVAAQVAQRAQAYFAARGAAPRAAQAALVAARASLEAGDAGAAGRAVEAAAALLADRDLPWLRWQIEAARAYTAEMRGEPEAALADYERALLHAETLGGALAADESRITFMRDKADLYARAVALRGRQGTARQVWDLIERAKSQALLARRGAAATAAPPELLRVRERLHYLYAQLDQATNPPARLYEQIAADERTWLEAMRLSTTLPGAPAAPRRDPQAALGAATLVEYFHDAAGWLALVATRREVRIHRLAADSTELEVAVRRLRFHIARQGLRDEHFTRHRALSLRSISRGLEHLGNLLLAPIRDCLAPGPLVIVPHGVLHAAPFGALTIERRALWEDHVVALAPSAAVYAACAAQAPSPFQSDLLVAGTPAAAAVEVRQAAARLPRAEVLYGLAAGVAAVSEAAQRSRGIHIAAHGLYRPESPYSSALQLADGRLPVAEIQQLRLHADWVVLSGCGTALGDVDGGDEVIGLTRAFLVAGARCVVASLWDVDDAATAAFMTLFYERLHASDGIAAAVRAASLAFRERDEHPFYWAAFQALGAGLV